MAVEIISKYNSYILSSIKQEHLEEIKKWRNIQIDILRQWKPLTTKNQNLWFDSLSLDEKQVLFSFFIINKDSILNDSEINKADIKFIGYCGLTNIDFKNLRAEISFLINPHRSIESDVYNKDFISGLKMLCSYAFEKLPLAKIFTETYEFRVHHIDILEKFGFHKDGVLRNHIFENGSFHNSVIHSLLREEWSLTKKEIRGLNE